ncbi:hypothetical protein VC218_17105 [Xanthomonas nasturtii]|uniref:hypothetical protein n=1 Tax=Xanthomonas nasturtii TaxID=1843581 RepID=UPI002B22C53A|nr:hypothetical protein [Xanthomonas nasturtii]MEA9580551.1 hypothetical protein [Xanthomonas nasturtii]
MTVFNARGAEKRLRRGNLFPQGEHLPPTHFRVVDCQRYHEQQFRDEKQLHCFGQCQIHSTPLEYQKEHAKHDDVTDLINDKPPKPSSPRSPHAVLALLDYLENHFATSLTGQSQTSPPGVLSHYHSEDTRRRERHNLLSTAAISASYRRQTS